MFFILANNPSTAIDKLDSAADGEETDINLAILRQSQQDTNNRLRNIQSVVVQMSSQQQRGIYLQTRDWLLLTLILCLQTFLQFLFSRY